MSQFIGGVNDTELDLVDGRAVGLLEHYGAAGAGYWLWRALSSSEQELFSDVQLEQLAADDIRERLKMFKREDRAR